MSDEEDAPIGFALFENYDTSSSSSSSSSSVSDDEGETKESKSRSDDEDDDLPASLTLRRDVSLSKNTLESLENRLLALKEEMLETTAKHEKKILGLETQIKKEKLQHSSYLSRAQNEKTAIEHAIASAIEVRENLKKTNPEALEQREEQTCCGICLERPRDALCAPCGHIAMCEKCARLIKASDNPQCPYCRNPIVAVYKTYHV